MKLINMYVDAHIHLYDKIYIGSLDNIIKESIENGVTYILSVSEDYETSIKNLTIGRKYEIYIGIGMHPSTAIYKLDELSSMIQLIVDNLDEIIAIGEVGLDKKYPKNISQWEDEVKVFKEMVKLSVEYNKPLNIHSRGASKEVLEILIREGVENAYFHWFTGEEEILKEIVNEGYYIGLTPSVLYSKRIMRIARKTPIDNILTETDGPIRFYGPLKNEITLPIHVRLIAKKLSEIKEIEHDEMVKIIQENFKKLFMI